MAMLELILTVATSDDADQQESDLARPRTVKVQSEPGKKIAIGRDPSRCGLVTPKDWRFVSRVHLEFVYSLERGWSVEWLQGSHPRPVALVQIDREGVSEPVPYGATLPLGSLRPGRVVVTDLARRRRVLVEWRVSLPQRPGEEPTEPDVGVPETQDVAPFVLQNRLSETEMEVLAALSCDWVHGRPVKRAKSTKELCELLHLSAATVERYKTKLRREFYSSGLCPELNALLGPNYLDTVRHVHGGWDLIAQTAVTHGITGRGPCPCGADAPHAGTR
ncbi:MULTISPECIES: hypothetical protein [Embleya]|jgi:hypothetical protein|uniref:hypothetical protein n=2 Tax=Streptomycetaceae TaxID=2062 RepID=UPI00037312BB|nr:hypothetical protein [Embleya scabrispora]